MKLLQRILTDARVIAVSDERDTGEGFWIYLRSGFITSTTETGSIHEDTLAKAYAALRSTVSAVPVPEPEPVLHRVTLKQVNAALRAAGIEGELIREADYHYFWGDSFGFLISTCVYTCQTGTYTVKQWLEIAQELIAHAGGDQRGAQS